MRKFLLAIVLILAASAALAQHHRLRPNMPPQTALGNPNAINAPAQAIPFSVLTTDIGAANLLNPTLPSTVDLNNLPPQTVVGNGTSSPAALGFVTFSQLHALSTQSGLPSTIYNAYDPTNIPGLTIVGNLSNVDALALPVSLGNIFGEALMLEDNVSFLLLEDGVSHLCFEGKAC